MATPRHPHSRTCRQALRNRHAHGKRCAYCGLRLVPANGLHATRGHECIRTNLITSPSWLSTLARRACVSCSCALHVKWHGILTGAHTLPDLLYFEVPGACKHAAHVCSDRSALHRLKRAQSGHPQPKHRRTAIRQAPLRQIIKQRK